MPRSLRVIIQDSLQSINGSFWCQWHRPRFSKSRLWKHLWILHTSDLGLQLCKQVLDLSLIFVLELSVSHSECAVRCVPISMGWGVLFCSNGMVTPLEIMAIILWLTLTLPDYILMTVQLIHFYCLCLGMEVLECAANALEIKSARGPGGVICTQLYICAPKAKRLWNQKGFSRGSAALPWVHQECHPCWEAVGSANKFLWHRAPRETQVGVTGCRKSGAAAESLPVL